jgi:hypothetical protein
MCALVMSILTPCSNSVQGWGRLVSGAAFSSNSSNDKKSSSAKKEMSASSRTHRHGPPSSHGSHVRSEFSHPVDHLAGMKAPSSSPGSVEAGSGSAPYKCPRCSNYLTHDPEGSAFYCAVCSSWSKVPKTSLGEAAGEPPSFSESTLHYKKVGGWPSRLAPGGR